MSKKTDKRNKLVEKPFSYKITKSTNMMIYWNNQHIKTLNNADSKRIISKINDKSDHQIQLILAKITGNFKRGNEKK